MRLLLSQPPFLPMPDAVIIVAKWPRPGQVKTRLCPPLAHEQAAEVAHAFLEDTVSAARTVEAVDIYIGIDGDRKAFEGAFPGVGLLPQGKGDLGTRMTHLVEAAFRRRYQKVVLIG